MAKKVRRARLSATQSYIPTTTATTNQAGKTLSETSRTVNFQEEYRYIISDLRRIGILAAVILSGLGILSFFIK